MLQDIVQWQSSRTCSAQLTPTALDELEA